MDYLTSLLNTGLSSQNSQLSNYCAITIANIMRGFYDEKEFDEKEIVSVMNRLISTNPDCTSLQKQQSTNPDRTSLQKRQCTNQ